MSETLRQSVSFAAKSEPDQVHSLAVAALLAESYFGHPSAAQTLLPLLFPPPEYGLAALPVHALLVSLWIKKIKCRG